MPGSQTLRSYKIKIDADIKSAEQNIEALQKLVSNKKNAASFGDSISSSIQSAIKSIEELKKASDNNFKNIQKSINKVSAAKLNTEIEQSLSGLQKQAAAIKTQTELLKEFSDSVKSNSDISSFVTKMVEPFSKLTTAIENATQQLELLNNIKIGSVDVSSVNNAKTQVVESTDDIINAIKNLKKKSGNIKLGLKDDLNDNYREYENNIMEIALAIDNLISSVEHLKDADINKIFAANKLNIPISTLKSYRKEIDRLNPSWNVNQTRPEEYKQGKPMDAEVTVHYKVSDEAGTSSDVENITNQIQEKVIKKVNQNLENHDTHHINIPVKADVKNLKKAITEQIDELNKNIKAGSSGIPDIEINVKGVINDTKFDREVEAISDEINKRTGINLNGGSVNISDAGEIGNNIASIASILKGWDQSGISTSFGNKNKNYNKAYSRIDQARNENESSRLPLFINGKTLSSAATEFAKYTQNIQGAIAVEQNYLNVLKKAQKAKTLDKLKESELYSATLAGSDGKVYSKYGKDKNHNRYLAEDWQKLLEKYFNEGILNIDRKTLASNINKQVNEIFEIAFDNKKGKEERISQLNASKLYSETITGSDGKLYSKYGIDGNNKRILIEDWQDSLNKSLKENKFDINLKPFKERFKQEVSDVFNISQAEFTSKRRLNALVKGASTNGLEYKKEKGVYKLIDAKGSALGTGDVKDLYTRKILETEQPFRQQLAAIKNTISELEELRSLLREVKDDPTKAELPEKVNRIKELAREVKGDTEQERNANTQTIASLTQQYETLLSKGSKEGLNETEYNTLKNIPSQIEQLYRPIDDVVKFAKEQTEILSGGELSSIDKQINDARIESDNIFKSARKAVNAMLNGTGQLNSETMEAMREYDVFEYITDSKQYKADIKSLQKKNTRLNQLSTLATVENGRTKFHGTQAEETEYYQLKKEVSNISKRVKLHQQAALQQEQINKADKEVLDYSLRLTDEKQSNNVKMKLGYSEEAVGEYSSFMSKVATEGQKNINSIITRMTDEELQSLADSTSNLLNEINNKANKSDKEIDKIVDSMVDSAIESMKQDLANAKADLKDKIQNDRSLYSIDKAQTKISRIETGISQLQNARKGIFDKPVDAESIIKKAEADKHAYEQFIDKFADAENGYQELFTDYEKILSDRSNLEKAKELLKTKNIDPNKNIVTLSTNIQKDLKKYIGDDFKSITEAEEHFIQANKVYTEKIVEIFGEENLNTFLNLANNLSQSNTMLNGVRGGKGNRKGYFAQGTYIGDGYTAAYTETMYQKRRDLYKESLNFGKAEEETVADVYELLIKEQKTRKEKLENQNNINDSYRSEIKSNQDLLQLKKQELKVIQERIDILSTKASQENTNSLNETYNTVRDKSSFGFLDKIIEKEISDYRNQISQIRNELSEKYKIRKDYNVSDEDFKKNNEDQILELKKKISTLRETVARLNNRSLTYIETQSNLINQAANKNFEVAKSQLKNKLSELNKLELQRTSVSLDETSKNELEKKITKAQDEFLKESKKYYTASGDKIVDKEVYDKAKSIFELRNKDLINKRSEYAQAKNDLAIQEAQKQSLIEQTEQLNLQVEAEKERSSEQKEFQKGLGNSKSKKELSSSIDSKLIEIQNLLNNEPVNPDQYKIWLSVIKQAQKELLVLQNNAKEVGLTISSITGRAYGGKTNKDATIIPGVSTLEDVESKIGRITNLEHKFEEDRNTAEYKLKKLTQDNIKIQEELNDIVLKEQLGIVNKEIDAQIKQSQAFNQYSKEVKELYNGHYFAGMSQDQADIAKKLQEIVVKTKNGTKATKDQKDEIERLRSLIIKSGLQVNDHGYAVSGVSLEQWMQNPFAYNTNTYTDSAIFGKDRGVFGGYATESTVQKILNVLSSGVNYKKTDYQKSSKITSVQKLGKDYSKYKNDLNSGVEDKFNKAANDLISKGYKIYHNLEKDEYFFKGKNKEYKTNEKIVDITNQFGEALNENTKEVKNNTSERSKSSKKSSKTTNKKSTSSSVDQSILDEKTSLKTDMMAIAEYANKTAVLDNEEKAIKKCKEGSKAYKKHAEAIEQAKKALEEFEAENKDIVDKVSAVENITNNEYSKDWAEKFVNGVEATTPEMKKAFEDFSKAGIETVKNLYGINSPSKVMEELGYWTGKGFQKGIKESEDEIQKAIIEAFKNNKLTTKDVLDWYSGLTNIEGLRTKVGNAFTKLMPNLNTLLVDSTTNGKDTKKEISGKYGILKNNLKEILRLTKEYNREKNGFTREDIQNSINQLNQENEIVRKELDSYNEILPIEENRLSILKQTIDLENRKRENNELSYIEAQERQAEELAKKHEEINAVLAKDTDEWQNALLLLKPYKDELGSIAKITRQITVDGKTGLENISYKYTDVNNNSRIVGLGGLINQNDVVVDMAGSYKKLKSATEDYYRAQSKIIKGDRAERTLFDSATAYHRIIESQKEINRWKQAGLNPSSEELQIEEKLAVTMNQISNMKQTAGMEKMYDAVLNRIESLNNKQKELNELKLKAGNAEEFKETIEEITTDIGILLDELRGFNFGDFFSDNTLQQLGVDGSQLLMSSNSLDTLKNITTILPLSEEQINKLNSALLKNTQIREQNEAAINKNARSAEAAKKKEQDAQISNYEKDIAASLNKQFDLQSKIISLDDGHHVEEVKELDVQLGKVISDYNKLIAEYKEFISVSGNASRLNEIVATTSANGYSQIGLAYSRVKDKSAAAQIKSETANNKAALIQQNTKRKELEKDIVKLLNQRYDLQTKIIKLDDGTHSQEIMVLKSDLEEVKKDYDSLINKHRNLTNEIGNVAALEKFNKLLQNIKKSGEKSVTLATKSVEDARANAARKAAEKAATTPAVVRKYLSDIDLSYLSESQLSSRKNAINNAIASNPSYANELSEKLLQTETELNNKISARNKLINDSRQSLLDEVEICKDQNEKLEQAKKLAADFGLEIGDAIDAQVKFVKGKNVSNAKNIWTITGLGNKYTITESINKTTGEIERQVTKVEELNNTYTKTQKLIKAIENAKSKYSNILDYDPNMFGNQKQTVQNLQDILRSFDNIDLSKLDSNKINEFEKALVLLNKESKKLVVDGKLGNIAKDYDLSVLDNRKQALKKLADTYIEGSVQEDKYTKNMTVLTRSVKTADGMLKTYTLTLDKAGDVTKQFVSETEYIGTFGKAIRSITGEFSKLARYMLASLSFYRIIGFFRSGLQIVQELDTAMTEMQKVSNDTEDALRNFAKESHKIAQEIGSTAATIQNSAADWMRLGYSINEASELAKNTSILMNVSEFDTIDAATESMVAMIQAFKDANADVGDLSLEIIDKLNNIGNNYSISTSELAESLKRSSGTLIEAGNSIDEAIALTTAGNAIIQDAESTGSALKVISMRIRGTSAKELEDIGEDTEGLIETTSKLEAKVKSLTKVAGKEGISLLDEKGNYRSTYEILQDIADVWEQINEEDQKTGQNRQAALLELLAGKTRAQSLASLLQNAEMLRNVYEDVQHSEGSAAKENEEYLSSIAAHIEIVKAKWQEMWDSAINRKQVNFVVDAAGKLLDILTDAGLVKTLTLMGSVFAGGKLTQFGINPTDIIKNIGNKNSNNPITTMLGGQSFSFGSDQTSLIDQFMELARAEQDCTDVLEKMTPAARDYAYAALDVEKKTGQVSKGFDAMNRSSRAAAIGTSILNAAINAGIIWLASIAVEALIKQLDEWIVTNEELKQSVDELMNSFNSQYETASRNLDTWNKMSEEYVRLSKGIDNLGNNVKLTTEDFKKYNELSNQIAQMSPDLVKGWTNEGVAIISLKNNVDELTNSYIEAKKAAYETLIANKDSDNIIKEYQKTIVNNQGWKSSGLNEKQELSRVISNSNSIDEVYSGIYNQFGQDYVTLKRIQKLLKDEYDLNVDISEDMSQANTYLLDPINISQDQLNDIRMVAKAQVHTYQSEINSQLRNVNTLADAYLNLYLLDDSKYSEISDNAKTVANILVQNIDESLASQFKDKTDVDIYVQRILDELTNETYGKEIQQAISDLYTLDIDNMSIEEAEQQIDAYKKILAKYIEDDDIYWNIIFTLQDSGSWKELKNNKKAYRNLIEDITEDMFGSSKQKAWLFGDYDAYEKQYDEIQGLFDKYGINTKEEADKFRDVWVKSGYDVYKALDKYIEQTIEDSKQSLSSFLQVEKDGTSRADGIDNYLTKVSNLQQKITGLRNGTINTSEEIVNIATEFGITANSADELADKLDELINDEFKKMNQTLDDYILEAEEAGDTGLVEELNRIKEACATATLEAKNLQNAFSNQKDLGINIIGLTSGMDQINSIYEDVYNKEGFDFTSIIGNTDFYDQFHDYVTEYNQLIDAISDSPDDIKKCQKAFDDLADAYIKSGNALDDLNESNKNHAKTYLETLGVTNSEEMIQAEFTAQQIDNVAQQAKALLEQQQIYEESIRSSNRYKDATEEADEAIRIHRNSIYAEIDALFSECDALNNATEAEKAYYLEKQLTAFDFVSGDIEQLNVIIGSLGLGAEAWTKYYQARMEMADIAAKVESGEMSAWMGKLKTAHLSVMSKVDLAQYQKGISDKASSYEIEPPEVAKARKDAAGGAGKDAADAYAEAFQEELSNLEFLRDNNFISEKEYLDRFKALYEKYYGDLDKYAKQYYENQRKYLEGMKSLYENAGNAAIYFLNRQIDQYNDARDKAKEELETQKKAKQEVIDSINEEIDKINEANDARQKQIDLQKSLYELEKAQHQRPNLVYNEEKGYHYEGDANAQRDASEDVYQKKLEMTIQKKQEELKVFEDELEAIEKQSDAIDEYYDKLIKGIEDYIKKWQDALEEATIRENLDYLDQLGISLNDVLSLSPDVFNKFKSGYFGILNDLDAFRNYPQDIFDPVVDAINGVSDAIDKLTDTMSGGQPQIDDTAQSMINLDQCIVDVTEKIPAAGDALSEFLTESFNVTECNHNVKDSLDEVSNGFWDLSNRATETVESLSEESMPNMAETISTYTGQSVGHFNSLGSSIDGVVGKVGSLISKLQELARQKINDTINGVSTFIKGKGALGGTAYAGGKWQAGVDSTALVGEEGAEIVAHRNGTFDVVGSNGAQFANIKHDDVVFNAAQTKALLEDGYINSRGKAYAGGTNNYTPLSLADPNKYKMFTALDSVSTDTDKMAYTLTDINKSIDKMCAAIAPSNTTSHVNNAPVINGGIHISCPGITEQEVLEDIAKQLSQNFSGLAMNAYQRSMSNR